MAEACHHAALLALGFKVARAAFGVVVQLVELVAETFVGVMDHVALKFAVGARGHEFLMRAAVFDAHALGREQIGRASCRERV